MLRTSMRLAVGLLLAAVLPAGSAEGDDASKQTDPPEFPETIKTHVFKQDTEKRSLRVPMDEGGRMQSIDIWVHWKDVIDHSTLRAAFFPFEDKHCWTWKNKRVFTVDGLPGDQALKSFYTLRGGTREVKVPRPTWDIHEAHAKVETTLAHGRFRLGKRVESLPK